MPLPLLEEIEIVVPTLAPPPTITPQTTEASSQASKGISLGALGLHGVYLEYHRGVYPYNFSI